MPHFPKPFFKKSRGLWYVQVHRKQINLGPDHDEAQRLYHQLMLEPRRRHVPLTSLAAVIDAFVDWVQRHRSADTFEWYRYRLQRLCERYPDLNANELKPFHIQQWVDSYALSRTSKRNYVRTIKRCCKWAVQQGYLEQNPIAHMEVPGGDRREDVVTVAEYEQLLSSIRNEAMRDLVVITWETGCRPQESLRVEARHVDLARQRWVFPQRESKGNRTPRIVYLTDKAMEITTRRMKQYPEGPLFRNSIGNPWTPDAVNCAFDRARWRILEKRG